MNRGQIEAGEAWGVANKQTKESEAAGAHLVCNCFNYGRVVHLLEVRSCFG